MSGSTGAGRVQSREHFQQFLKSYEDVIKKFPGFVSIKPSGSYNSNLSKTTFGDIDLITHIKSDKDKAEVKKELVAFFTKLPDTTIVPFSSDRYKGKRALNTGEIVTVRYHDPKLGYSVQVDNIIALDHTEAQFKGNFLDLPAEKQGLILGLAKVATIETPLADLFKRLGIHEPTDLPEDTEYEFNLSSIELQLRKVVYEPGSYKQKSRDVVWKSRNIGDVKKLLFQYNLDLPFEKLLAQAKAKIKNPRSGKRISGVFSSMVSVKSGEVGTEKGAGKEDALRKVHQAFGESVVGFKGFIKEARSVSKEPSNRKQVKASEVQGLIGKGAFTSLLKHPWWTHFHSYEKAFIHSVDNAGFHHLEMFPYMASVHRTTSGRVRPTIRIEFIISHFGASGRVVQAHKFTRDQEPSPDDDKRGGGWRFLRSWKD